MTSQNLIGGRYQIVEKLGQGGFGITFKAVDTQLPGNPLCVVKQFKPQNPNNWEIGKRLFEREAEQLQKLQELINHQQIPRILAYLTENQEFYLVQEYIQGHDLSQELVYGKQLSETDVIQLLRDILEVLSFVHKRYLIHRDIKPSNILRRASDNKIFLIDFGAVKEITTQIANPQGQLNSVTIIGSAGYAPIEQCYGRPALSSDIYAVGVIAIQALTGIFPPNSAIFTPHNGEIIWRDRAQVSPELANIIDKMVRRDYNQRYPSAAEALQAVNALILPPDIIQSPPPSRKITQKQWLGVGIFATITPVILWLGFSAIRPQPQPLTKEYSQSDIKIKYPDNWKTKITGDFGGESIQFLPQNIQQENSCIPEITVNKTALTQVLSLNEYKNTILEQIKQNYPQAKITDATQPTTTLSQYNAYKLTYSHKEYQCQSQVLEIGTVREGNAYYITYTAEQKEYNRYLPLVEAMINSFEIKTQSNLLLNPPQNL
ncbi:serine/threonine-protein kinase [Nostoc sp. FACHB-190]|uniref:serine/threonine-protein kinase n=1 Tax=Nostoc sp. FACHB-190 TaxID=2692838 RepID=UPI0016848A67|nr:serine/threonine-protein kinase [Nostoc sp. FACHB-190]MBD2298646.1 serine/threonine protein kinase [Nostoc sp. FACHB-190]